MQFRKVELFPTTVLIVKNCELANFQKQRLIDDINYVIHKKEYMQIDEVTVKEQCKPILWRKDIQWYKDEYNTDWDILKESFISACQLYIDQVQTYVKKPESVFFTYARAWFYKSWHDLNITQQNPPHDHSFALLTGVYYLKIPGFDPATSGTEVFDPRFENAESSRSYAISGEEGTWAIFPGWLKHRSMRVETNDPRYVIACDLFAAAS